jgi:hypothetical protein
VVRGRQVDLAGILGGMAGHWDAGMAMLVGRYGA